MKKLKLNNIVYQIYDISGVRFLIEKIKPGLKGNKNNPSSFFIWCIGIYVALYGIAASRFENDYTRMENRTYDIVSQINNLNNKYPFRNISLVKRLQCPIKPDIKIPKSIYKSFTLEEIPNEFNLLIRNAINFRKEYLDNCIISNCDISDYDLSGAKFFNTVLSQVNISNTTLERSQFNFAVLDSVNFSNSNLSDVKFNNTKIYRSIFEKSILQGVKIDSTLMLNCNMRNITSQFSFFNNSELLNTRLDSSCFWFTYFMRSRLDSSIFDYSEIKETDFSESQLLNCSFSHVNLDSCKISIEQLLEIRNLNDTVIDSLNYRIIKNYFPQQLIISDDMSTKKKIDMLKEFDKVIVNENLPYDLSKYRNRY